jgi:hypothetical protein
MPYYLIGGHEKYNLDSKDDNPGVTYLTIGIRCWGEGSNRTTVQDRI